MNVNPTKRSREERSDTIFPAQKRQRTTESTASFAQTHLNSNLNRPPIKINFSPKKENPTPIKINFPPNSGSSNSVTSSSIFSPNRLEALQTLCFQIEQSQEQPSDVNALQTLCFQIEQSQEQPSDVNALQTLCFQIEQTQEQPSDVNALQTLCFQIEQALEEK